ncbi:hypothetical protein ES703_42649 [subsurface metagenome]
MDEKALLVSEVKNLYKRVVAVSEKDPRLVVNLATKEMYLAYVKKMKTLFPENEEVKNLSEKFGVTFMYADLSNLVGRLMVLLRFLVR